MPPADLLDAVRTHIDARLTDRLDRLDAHARALAPPALPMLRAARELTLRGGKRMRPALLFAAVECVRPSEFSEAAVDLGAALELLQTYLLIHDDWMDGDRVRRGAPSVHAALEAHYGDVHLGHCTAILAGDMISALTHEMVSSLDVSREVQRDVLAAFAVMEREVILGQCLDVTHDPDVERIHRLKTGSYTVRGPLLLGLALASAPADIRDAIERFAGPLGVAFQLRDDVLGVFGSPEETGKPVGGDLREGKETALVQHARRTLVGADRDLLLRVLGNRSASDEDVLRARDLIASSGALDEVEARITSLRDESLSALAAGGLRSEGAALLGVLTDRITRRSR